MTVPDWLGRAAAARPRHPALVSADGTLDYRALDAEADAVAAALRALGLPAGARLGALLPNGVALVTLVHAAPRAGVLLVLLDPRATPDEVAALARRAGVSALVVDGSTAALATASGVPLLRTPLRAPARVVATAPPALDLDAPHTVVFTSGTSGTPRPVVLTAGNHLWSAAGSAARVGAPSTERWLACLPLWHVGGLAVVLRSAIHATTMVLHGRFQAEAVARALHEDRVTALSLVPTALARLARDAPPRDLRCALVGGAAAAPSLLHEAAATGWPVAPTYGCTEAASQVATAAPGDPRALDGTVGVPLLATDVRVVRPDGASAAAGETGEIQVRGATVGPGILAADGGIEPLAVDGWLRTADLGALDHDGTLRVVGRRDDVIVTGGENVAPDEVEAVLATLSGVAEVAVRAVPDPEWGHAVAAWVVPPAGAAAPTLEALRDGARGRLAPHKLPRRLYVVRTLPRTASGKVRRRELAPPDGR